MVVKQFYILSITILLIVIKVSAANEDDKCQCESKLSLRTKAGVKAATAGLVTAFGTTTTLGSSIVGFTATGIAKGSIAAFIQAKLGTFGLFSMLQSFGATGALSMLGPPGLAIMGVVGAASYWYISSESAAPAGCNCNDSELSTEEDLTQFFELKAIAYCVEPGTSKERVCSGRGSCEIDKDDEELFCKCQPNFDGTYCELLKNRVHALDSKTQTPSNLIRCKDEFIQNCVRCLIHKFTLNNPTNCYKYCNWDNRVSQLAKDDDMRPDVVSLEMKRVPKLSVMQGTECSVQINASCSTVTKYIYEHTEDYLDQLVIYYSSDEAECDKI